MPTKGSVSAAGLDLYADIQNGNITILPGQTTMIHTGISAEIPEGYFGGLYARSGLATKQGVRPANCVGIIDSDYRGEVIVALHNDSSEAVTVSAGQRIAQLVIQPYLGVEVEETEDLSDTNRGFGGFGSTGK